MKKDKFYKVKKVPKTGQFVAMWVISDTVWSAVYKWIDGVLHEYFQNVDGSDPYTKCDLPEIDIDSTITYYVTDRRTNKL